MGTRRVVLLVGCALTVVSAAGAAALTYLRANGDEGPPPPVPAEQLMFQGQRLIPERAFMVNRASGTPEPRIAIPAFEILAGGSVVPSLVQLAPNESADRIVTTADGGIAMGATRDLAPGVRRPDGPFVDDLEFPLIVFSHQGQRIVDQNLRVRGEYVIMLGMVPGQAFIARGSASEVSGGDPVRIVSRSLSSGQERPLLISDLPVSRGDAAGRHLVLGGDGLAGPPTVTKSPNCWVRIVDLTDLTGERLDIPDCVRLLGMKSSPDDGRVAIAYERLPSQGPELMLSIMDMTGGIVGGYRVNGHEDCSNCLRAATSGYLGMAWTSSATVRLALLDPVPLKPRKAGALTLEDLSRHIRLREY